MVLAYQQASCAIVERYGGSVAQYLGDGLLVYFGHPQAYEDAPERAVRAAMAMVDAIRDLRLDALAGPATQPTLLSVRIGIHTGQVVIGHVGAGTRREHLALGDTPNIAARLQGVAAPDTVVLSDSTRRMAGGSFAYTDLGKHRLKGVREPRHVFRVDAILAPASRFEAATGTGLSPLVGRSRELGLLIDRWELARQGRGQTVLLGGEAGVGKSRVLKELRARLGNAGLGAVLLQCSAHHVDTSFHPSIDALTRALELSRDESVSSKLDRLEALAIGQYGLSPQSAAVLAAMLSLSGHQRYPPLVSDAHAREQETIAALVALARGRAAIAPALMIVEDAHWADSGTMAVLEALIEGTSDVPLLLIVTHRPEFRLGEHLAARPNVASVKVLALDAHEVTELVARMAGDAPLADDLTRHILSKTDGVPLFVEELTRWILETSATSEGARKEVPATLRDSLMARLDRDPRAKEVAQIGAVFGREFRRDMLVALADIPTPQIAEGLASLTRSGLASEQMEHEGVVYTFKHALVQDVAYDSMLKSRRESLHGTLVSVIEHSFPSVARAEPQLLARHANAAGQPHIAVPYWRRASEMAVQRLALGEAAAHLNAGVAACESLPASPERNQIEMQLQATLGTVEMMRRGWGAAEVSLAFARANALASRADRVDEAIWSLWGLCVFHLVRGEITRAASIGHRMMTVARQAGSRNAWLVTNMMHVQLCMYSGRFAEVAGQVEQVEHRYCDPEDRALISLYSTDLKLVAMVHGSQTRLIMGLEEEADARCAEQERYAASLNHPYSLAWTLTWGAMSFLFRGRADELLSRVEEGLRLSRKHGYPYVTGMAMVQKGWAYAQQMRLEEGISLMEDGIASFRGAGSGIVVPFFLVLFAEAQGRAGRATEALAALDEADRLVAWGGESWYESEGHRIRGKILSMGSAVDRLTAEESLRRALAVASGQQAALFIDRATRDLAELVGSSEHDSERGDDPGSAVTRH